MTVETSSAKCHEVKMGALAASSTMTLICENLSRRHKRYHVMYCIGATDLGHMAGREARGIFTKALRKMKICTQQRSGYGRCLVYISARPDLASSRRQITKI